MKGTNQERGDAAKEHDAELQGADPKERADKTPKGNRRHDWRNPRLSNSTSVKGTVVFRGEVKNYRPFLTVKQSGRNVTVRNTVRATPEILEQLDKDVLWIREGRKIGEDRVVQWVFYGAEPSETLQAYLKARGIAFVHKPYHREPGQTRRR